MRYFQNFLNRRFQSIKTKVIALNLFVLLFSIINISFVFFLKSSQIIKDNISQVNFIVNSVINKNIEFYIDEMQKIANYANYNYYIQQFLKNYNNMSEIEKLQVNNKIIELLNSFTSMREDIVNIIVFNKYGVLIKNNPERRFKKNFSMNIYNWFKNTKEDIVISPPHKQDYLEYHDSQDVISLCGNIRSYDSDEIVGKILIDLNLEVLQNIVQGVKLFKSGYVNIFSENKSLIYSENPQQAIEISKLIPSQKFKNGISLIKFNYKDYLVCTKYSRLTRWVVLSIIPVDETSITFYNMKKYIILFTLILGIFSILLSLNLTEKIIHPLIVLANNMKQFGKRENFIIPEYNSDDEIGTLYSAYANMNKKISELMNKLLNEEKEKRRIYLKSLQNQINPHFLNNTLELIIWFAQIKNFEGIMSVVSALSKLLRIGMSKDEVVPLSVEIEHVRNYLLIQQMRYRDKIDFIIDIPTEMLSLKIPKLTLQPVVENSIYHGLKNKEGKGLIKIYGRFLPDVAQIIVEDDGIGIAPEVIERIMNANDDKKEQIGLTNINKRLKLIFSEKCGISIESDGKSFTRVYINIPNTVGDKYE